MHQLEGEVSLQPDLRPQNQLENWIEYQDYHLRTHRRLEKGRDEFKQKLQAALEAEKPDTERVSVLQYRLEVKERRLGQHLNLLSWIEGQRRMMDATHTSSAGGHLANKDSALRVVQGPSASDRQQRQSKARAVLGNARVSKVEPRRSTRQCRRQKSITAAPATKTRDPLQSNGSFRQGSRKANRVRPDNQQPLHSPQPALVMTRSGRIFKSPGVVFTLDFTFGIHDTLQLTGLDDVAQWCLVNL